MADLREIIIERVRAVGDLNCPWVLDAYYHLLQCGASPEEAAEAMSSFVNDIIAEKARSEKE